MKLRFRRINDDDAAMIMGWRTAPEVSRYMYTDFEPDLEAQRRWLANIAADDTRRDWVIVVDDEDVGLVSLVKIDRRDRRCDWSYYLASPSVRGKGVGRAVELNVLRYVFEDLGLNKLCCEVFASNDLVVRIHQKYGSQIEGRRRQHVYKNGEHHDIVEMAILREDWQREIDGVLEVSLAQIEPFA